jgi:hypothetical protein
VSPVKYELGFYIPEDDIFQCAFCLGDGERSDIGVYYLIPSPATKFMLGFSSRYNKYQILGICTEF